MGYAKGSVVHVGISGTRGGWTDEQRQDFIDGMYDIIDDSAGCERIFHHGDCQGVDVESAKIARKMGFITVAHPPEKDTYRGWHDSDFIADEKPYFDRNRDIVDVSNEMFAVPKSMTDEKSGTWYTIKYTREQNKPITIIEP